MMPEADPVALQNLVQRIQAEVLSIPISIMEVCGTHTMAIARWGIKQLLPENVTLISGPGCPVCVTQVAYIDEAVALAGHPEILLCTFGDLLRVPGSQASLESARTQGGHVEVVASTLEALDLARNNPDKQIVFLGVGFETTAPTVAAAILEAHDTGLKNFSVLDAVKTMPEPLKLLSGMDNKIDAYLLPGHVSAVIGLKPYEILASEYGKACVVSGFEPGDILLSVLMLLRQLKGGTPKVENQYTRLVKPEGNPAAQALLDRVFKADDAVWRGLGMLPMSGLRIRPEYQYYDARHRFKVQVPPAREAAGCRCGEVLLGKIRPGECALFATRCTPMNPVGACMVSSEGSCAAEYQYADRTPA